MAEEEQNLSAACTDLSSAEPITVGGSVTSYTDLMWVAERARFWSSDKREASVKALAWNFVGMLKEWNARAAIAQATGEGR